ncbi:MAG: hypothetical protein R3B90_15020 [Planctomycetaceae bacterium]
MRRFPVSAICLLLALLVTLTGGKVEAAKEKGRRKENSQVLTGTWLGAYDYPDGRAGVQFSMTLVQQQGRVFGLIREINTFGVTQTPWLHAYVEGKIDPESRQVTLTKTYDGTSGQSHAVAYTATLDEDGDKLTGTWDIDGYGGTFGVHKTSAGGSSRRDGVYRGEYSYPAGTDQSPVPFVLLLVSDGPRRLRASSGAQHVRPSAGTVLAQPLFGCDRRRWRARSSSSSTTAPAADRTRSSTKRRSATRADYW